MPNRAEWKTELTFDQDEVFDISMEEEETFSTSMDQVVEVVTGDHRMLLYRDAENQHPIAAISYLNPELAARPSASMTNIDIQNILNS